MANRERGEIGVTVGEKAYTLRPTFDSICELDQLTGKTIDDLYRDINAGKLSGLRACVWCLLQDEHSDEIRTLKDASQWIERAGGPAVMITLLAQSRDLNTEVQPAVRGRANGARPRKAQAGTGGRSSRAHSKSA